MSTYLHTYLPLTTYQPMSTYLPLPTYINIPTYLYQHTYLPISSFQHIPTHVNLPSSTYLPVPIPKYQYIIAADPGAGIGLVSIENISQKIEFLSDRTFWTYIIKNFHQPKLPFHLTSCSS